MRFSEEFVTLKEIRELNEKMVEMKKNIVYPLVYSLVTLLLVLRLQPVTTATVESVFSTINVVKKIVYVTDYEICE